VLADLVRSRNDLDDAWRPLAQRFTDLVVSARSVSEA
jgi:hypothetical protein